MFKSYLTVAWRSLTRNKGYAAINIAGLATGMAIALMIGLWVADEMSFDHYTPNHSRIARGMVRSSPRESPLRPSPLRPGCPLIQPSDYQQGSASTPVSSATQS